MCLYFQSSSVLFLLKLEMQFCNLCSKYFCCRRVCICCSNSIEPWVVLGPNQIWWGKWWQISPFIFLTFDVSVYLPFHLFSLVTLHILSILTVCLLSAQCHWSSATFPFSFPVFFFFYAVSPLFLFTLHCDMGAVLLFSCF